MAQLFFAAMVFVLIIEPSAGQAQAKVIPGWSGQVRVDVVSDVRGSLSAIPFDDSSRSGSRMTKQFIEAQRGENYGIVVQNNTPGRVGVVIAVDGRNIIDGTRSDLKQNEAMYIVNGYETARYEGWRTSRNEVQRFYFTEASDSYSVKTFGDTSALGVIAVAVYRENEQQLRQKHAPASPPAPKSGAAPRNEKRALADESAGTGFGDVRYSSVLTVEFQAEATPFQKVLLKYEWRETLCRKGIIACGQEKNRLWDEEYAPCPPGYPRS